ncbi:MAG: hypothetical protein LRY40_04525 [Shewanella fodinae]|nr:hypothetical protein [Shewanella fodinae]
MKKLLVSLGLAGIALMLCGCESMKQQTEVAAPVAMKIPHAMTLHGVTRTDDYYWLRDDSHSDPQVLDYLRQENAYTAAKITAVLSRCNSNV